MAEKDSNPAYMTTVGDSWPLCCHLHTDWGRWTCPTSCAQSEINLDAKSSSHGTFLPPSIILTDVCFNDVADLGGLLSFEMM